MDLPSVTFHCWAQPAQPAILPGTLTERQPVEGDDQAWIDSPAGQIFVSWLETPQVRECIGTTFDIKKVPGIVDNKWAKAVREQFDALPKEEVESRESPSLQLKLNSAISGRKLELIQFLSAAGPESPIAKNFALRYVALRELVYTVIKERADMRESLMQIFSSQIEWLLTQAVEGHAFLGWNIQDPSLEEDKKFVEMFLSNANFKPQDADKAFVLAVRFSPSKVVEAFINYNKNIDKEIITLAFVNLMTILIHQRITEEGMKKMEIMLKIIPNDNSDIALVFSEAAHKKPEIIDNIFSNNLINKVFVKAASARYLKTVSALLEAGSKANVKDASISKILEGAIERRHFEIAIDLLEAGANLSLFSDTRINMVFVKAARARDLETVKALLEAGFKSNITDESISKILEEAIERRHFEIAIDLLEAGAKPGANLSLSDAIDKVSKENVIYRAPQTGKEIGHIGEKSASDMMNCILAKWPDMDMPDMDMPDMGT